MLKYVELNFAKTTGHWYERFMMNLEFLSADDHRLFNGAHEKLNGGIGFFIEKYDNDGHLALTSPVSDLRMVPHNVFKRSTLVTGRKRGGRAYNLDMLVWHQELKTFLRPNTRHRLLVYPKGAYFGRDNPGKRPKMSPYGFTRDIDSDYKYEDSLQGEPYMVVHFRYFKSTV